MEDMERRLERFEEKIEGKIDAITTTLGSVVTNIALLMASSDRSKSLEERVATLEKFRFYLAGGAAAIGMAAGVISHIVLK